MITLLNTVLQHVKVNVYIYFFIYIIMQTGLY